MKTRTFYIWRELDRNPEEDERFGWLVGEIPPTEMAYTYDCLEIDIDPADMDRHANAQKGQDIYDYLLEQGITHKNMNDYSKIYTGTVVYDLENREWVLLEDMDTIPTVTHWDGNNMQYYTLHEDCQQETIEVEDESTCLDRWDGNNMTTGGTGEHAHVYKATDGRFVLVLTSQWEGARDQAAIMDADELRRHLVSIGREDEAEDILGKEKLVGMQVRLPESLHKELKKKLIDDGGTIQDLFTKAVSDYLEK